MLNIFENMFIWHYFVYIWDIAVNIGEVLIRVSIVYTVTYAIIFYGITGIIFHRITPCRAEYILGDINFIRIFYHFSLLIWRV